MKELSKKLIEYFKAKGEFEKKDWDDFIEKIERPLADDKDINRVEIIVLKYKDPATEKDFFNHLVDYTSHYYKLTFFDNRPNSGNTAKIWNKLIKEATCDLIVIMDTDAFVAPGWLEPLVKTIKEYPDCVMAVPVMGGSTATPIQSTEHNIHALSFSIAKGAVSGFCFLIHKQRFLEIGEFDEDFYIFGQDSEICDRISSSKYHIRVCPASLVYHGTPPEPGSQIWNFSRSTRKAATEGEFKWELDTLYASELATLKRWQSEGREDLIEKFFKTGGI